MEEMRKIQDSLKVYFDNKEYDKCVEKLRYEIIFFLENKIKEKKPDFKYTTTKYLFEEALKTLDKEYADGALKIYNLDISDFSIEYDMYEMMNVCKDFGIKIK